MILMLPAVHFLPTMPSDHPFLQLFETFGKLPAAHAESVNHAARETLKGWLDAPLAREGHCILLKAPRAGYGKTHLLSKLQHELGETHEFIPLHAIGGCRIDASTALDDTLRHLVREIPAAGGLTAMDLFARRLFSSSLQPLVDSGEVPCEDRKGALLALRNRPIETLDFHHTGAMTAQWAKESFEVLAPRLALGLSQQNGLSLGEVSFWVDALFAFSTTPIGNPGRVHTLVAEVFDGASAGADSHERLATLLGLVSSLQRVVLVADELEGFPRDDTAAFQFASFLCSIRQAAQRTDVILSANQDVWQSSFLPHLSSGLADRLSEVVVELEPLDREGMLAVIESRLPGQGRRILDGIDPESVPTFARGIIRKAAGVFERKTDAEGETPENNGDPMTPDVSSVEPATADFATVPENFLEAPQESPFVEIQQDPDPRGEESVPNSPETDSPFRIDGSAGVAVEPVQELEEPAMPAPAPVSEPSRDGSADRVDELLRQFRERYGSS
jgi:hypothetical protein